MRTAIIGAGGIAQPHAKAIDELGVKIVGVLDPNVQNANAMAQRYGSKVITTLDEVMDDIDMIHLLTPPSKRVEYVRQAAKAGKHIFIEKPITVSIEEGKEVVRLATENNVKLLVGFNHRYRDGYRMLKEALDSGILGEVVSVYAHRLGAGAGFNNVWSPSWRTQKDLVCGMSIESVSHDIDMLLQLVDGVESISAHVNGTIKELPTFDNNAAVSFTTKGGGIGSIHASWSSHLGHSERGIIGTKGSCVIAGDDLWDFDNFIIRTVDMPYPQITKVGELFATTAYDSYLNTNRHFIECIEKDLEPLTSGEDGLRTLIFSHAILESSKTGKAVVVDL